MARRATTTSRRAARPERQDTASFQDLQGRLAVSVKWLRERAGITQEEAAHRCAMPTRLYVGIEHGESNATLLTLARLCEGLEVGVEELFSRRPRRTEAPPPA
jgi:transcriptional regulator with XRE-family HTH domain